MEYADWLIKEGLKQSNKTENFFNYIRKLSSKRLIRKFNEYYEGERDKTMRVYQDLGKKLKKIIEPVQYLKDSIYLKQEEITVIYNKYRSRSRDAVHKFTRYLIELCIEKNVGIIVLGYNEDWKQKVLFKHISIRQMLKPPKRKIVA